MLLSDLTFPGLAERRAAVVARLSIPVKPEDFSVSLNNQTP